MVDANDLVYLRARYYHPGLGVFTGLDPVENVNRYQYVGGNPVNHVDPSGLQDTELILTLCAGAVASPIDAIVGDLACVGTIAFLVMLGVIDWEEVAETSEELAEVVLDEIWENWGTEPESESEPEPDWEPRRPPFPYPFDRNPRQRRPRDSSTCPTNDPPDSTRPFDANNEMEDIVCNIRHYTALWGPQPGDWWTDLNGRVTPIFGNAWPGILASFVTGNRSLRYTEFGTRRHVVAAPTSMLIPRPGQYGAIPLRTRADIMTFVVHEMRHAGQYYSLFSDDSVGGHYLHCGNITGRIAEVDAWQKTNHWVIHSVFSDLLRASDFNEEAILYYNGGIFWSEDALWDHPHVTQYQHIYGDKFDTPPAFACPQSETSIVNTC